MHFTKKGLERFNLIVPVEKKGLSFFYKKELNNTTLF